MSNDKSHPATQHPSVAHSNSSVSSNNGFTGLLRSAEREREHGKVDYHIFMSIINELGFLGDSKVGVAHSNSSVSSNNGFIGLIRSVEREREWELQNHQMAK